MLFTLKIVDPPQDYVIHPQDYVKHPQDYINHPHGYVKHPQDYVNHPHFDSSGAAATAYEGLGACGWRAGRYTTEMYNYISTNTYLKTST